MPAAPRNPSPTHPIVTFPTERVQDVLLVTEHSTSLPNYEILPYGTAYNGPEKDKFPGLTLVFQEPSDVDKWVRRYWAADRASQESYNASLQYSGGSSTHPIYVRTYVLPRATYTAVALGTADPIAPTATLVDQTAEPTEKLAGYLTVKRVYETLPGPVLTGQVVTPDGQLGTVTTQRVVAGTELPAPGATTVSASVDPITAAVSKKELVTVGSVFPETTISVSRPDVIPPKFKRNVKSKSTRQVVAGTVNTNPTLGNGEMSKSESQFHVSKKRVETETRELPDLPVITNEQEFDESLGIIIPIVEELTATGVRIGTDGYEVNALDEEFDVARKKASTNAALAAVLLTYPTLERIKIPDLLTEVGIIWAQDEGNSTDRGQPVTLASSSGGTPVTETKFTFTISNSLSITGTPYYKVKSGFSDMADATLMTFALNVKAGTNVTAGTNDTPAKLKTSILAKTGAYDFWPKIIPEEDILIHVVNKSVTLRYSGTYSFGTYSAGGVQYPATSTSRSRSIATLRLPSNAIVPAGGISVIETGDKSGTVVCTIQGASYGPETVEAEIIGPTAISATGTQFNLTKKYITQVSITPYQHQWVKVTAIVVDVSQFA